VEEKFKSLNLFYTAAGKMILRQYARNRVRKNIRNRHTTLVQPTGHSWHKYRWLVKLVWEMTTVPVFPTAGLSVKKERPIPE